MAFESIHNYYEQLVVDRITDLVRDKRIEDDIDFIEDVACVALNQLPVRYVRHNVDTAFYMSTAERAKMLEEVEGAVDRAIDYIQQHRDDRPPDVHRT
jgi:hypothetical protein